MNPSEDETDQAPDASLKDVDERPEDNPSMEQVRLNPCFRAAS